MRPRPHRVLVADLWERGETDEVELRKIGDVPGAVDHDRCLTLLEEGHLGVVGPADVRRVLLLELVDVLERLYSSVALVQVTSVPSSLVSAPPN